MTLDVDTLATELQNCLPVDNEADAIDNFASAFETYFYDAACAGLSVASDSLDGPIGDMKTAMTGYSVAAVASMVAGLNAFWSSVGDNVAVIWAKVPPFASVTPPPGLATLAAALTATGAANVANKASLEDATAAIAANIHAATLGATATDSTTPTPLTFPIL